MVEDADTPDLASFEANSFGALIGFFEKVTVLLQASELHGENARVVVNRIKLMIQEITAEIKCSRKFNLAGRLESAYEEIRCLVEDLSDKGEQ